MRSASLLPVLLLALPLAAQDSAQNTLGLQLRLSGPGGNLPDVTGSRRPGLGASLQAELNFDSRVSWRIMAGADDWSAKADSQNHSVQAYHLGVEAVYFLRDEGGEYLRGPYLVGGFAAYTWAIGADARPSGVALRSTKGAIDAGFGYRITKHVDVELKVLAGKVDTDFTANATILGVSFRF